MKNSKRYLFFAIFLLFLVILTVLILLNGLSFSLVLSYLKKIKIEYIIICLIISILYFLLQGIYMKLILNSLNHKISLKRGLFYSMTEFYFSGITPSSTGGQPAQLYYMTKDKIPIRKSYIVLILNTIYFKLIIFILGIVVFIIGWNYILSKSLVYIFFFLLGLLVDFIIIVFSCLMLFKQNIIKKVLSYIILIASKFNFLKNKVKSINVDDVLKKYKNELNYIKSHKKLIILTFILTFIQRLLLFSIIYVIYRSLGFSSYNYFDLLIIQISVQVVIEAYPLPGGTGLSEEMINRFFSNLGLEFSAVLMLLTRMFSFYIPLIISGTAVLIGNIKKTFVKKLN